MSREIRFRAWFTDGAAKVLCGQVMSEQGDRTAAEFLMEIQDCCKEHGYNAILMQSTGLKDKNGVEIYESDIVNWKGMEYGDTQDYPEDLIDVVGEIECCYGSNEWLRNSPSQCEVIGNIHTHPDLLKGE